MGSMVYALLWVTQMQDISSTVFWSAKGLNLKRKSLGLEQYESLGACFFEF